MIMVIYMAVFYTVHQLRHSKVVLSKASVSCNRLAFKLSLKVIVYFMQFGGKNIEGFWIMFDTVAALVKYINLVTSSAGGLMNGAVVVLIMSMDTTAK